MVDLVKLGANSLQSVQRALTTTGHNIANANTEGYSRQSVHFSTADSLNTGFGYLGQGTRTASIERSYNSFLTSQVQNFSSSASRYDTFVAFSSRVDDIMANSNNSLSHSIQKFFNSMSDVSASPSTLPERQVLLGEATNMVERQQSFNKLLQDLNGEVNMEMRHTVTEINGLTDSIASINQQIVAARSVSAASAPNDLLDQRDVLIRQLAENLAVTTLEQDDGSLNIFTGSGQTLVVGSQATHLKTQTNPLDSSQLEVGVEGQINTNSMSQAVSGGKLQGLLDFRDRVLLPAQNGLGLVTLGLTKTINAQHQIGMDLNGDLGTDFFKPITIPVAGNTNNTGTAVPTVVIDDVKEIRATDYSLVFDGAQWQFTRLSDNTSVSGVGPLTLDGMTVDVSAGTATAADSFIINPARTAAANFSLAISDARKIAAAGPVLAHTPLSNSGTAVLGDLTVGANNSLPLAGPITLTFNPDALGPGLPGFDVAGEPGGILTLAYDPATESAGKTFSFPSPPGAGLSFTISDVPQTGDSLLINNNAGASGDNRNMAAIADLQYQPLLNGGNDNYQEFYGSMVAQIAVNHNQGRTSQIVEASQLQQAMNYRDSASGVNLDEEAANLIRFQQAYQASAQLVRVADEMFQALLSSIR